MSAAIIYCSEYAGVANGPQGGGEVGLSILAMPPIAQYAIIGTLGGLLTLAAVSSGGAGLVTGTYVNYPVTTTAAGSGATVSFTVSTAGTAYAFSVFVPGFNYTSSAFISINPSTNGAATTAGSILASVHIATILPCG